MHWNIENKKSQAIYHIREYAGRHWLVLLMTAVFLLSVWVHSLTGNNMVALIMFLSMGFLAFTAYYKKQELKEARTLEGASQQQDQYEMCTVLRVYTNDEDFQEYMHDEDYIQSQYVQLENRVLDITHNISSQIAFHPVPGYWYCYHIIIDSQNEQYFVGGYQ